MDECTGMDSTFMGVLAGLALRMKRERLGKIVAMNLTPKTASLLETLGLDRIIECFQSGEESESLNECLSGLGLSALEDTENGKKVTLETMLTAHQDLVRAAPGNEAKFKDVISYLDQDLKQLKVEKT